VFQSTETQVEALIVALSFAVFVIHTLTRAPANSFFDIRLLMNGNFVAGIVFAFIVGMVLFSTRALMPSMLQGLMHFTALDAGIVMAPSGLGSMLAMMIVGRLIGKIDTRLILAFGFGMTALSLYMMCGYTTELKMSDIIWPGVVQGIGLGFVFVPLSAAAFSTLASSLRPQGTAIYSLMRNIGSSVGIAMVQAFQVANSQTMHQSISDHMTLGNHALTMSRYLQGQGGLMALNIEVTRQASMIAYVDNFWLMLILTLCAMPLLIFMRSKK